MSVIITDIVNNVALGAARLQPYLNPPRIFFSTLVPIVPHHITMSCDSRWKINVGDLFKNIKHFSPLYVAK